VGQKVWENKLHGNMEKGYELEMGPQNWALRGENVHTMGEKKVKTLGGWCRTKV